MTAPLIPDVARAAGTATAVAPTPLGPLERLRAAVRARGRRWLATQALLTLVALAVAAATLPPLLRWLWWGADWRVVATNLRLFTLFRYPPDAAWRPAAALAIVAAAAGLAAGTGGQRGRVLGRVLAMALAVPVALPALAAPLQAGGTTLGDLAGAFAPARGHLAAGLAALGAGWLAARAVARRRPSGVRAAARLSRGAWALALPAALVLLAGRGAAAVPLDRWGGLLLTLVLAAVAIGLSFPLGVLLALGRRSALPLVRGLCTLFIEGVRGLPLITVLFMAALIVPLVVPDAWRPDAVIRAALGLTLFSAAYLAEDVRGGLDAVGHGQVEAARALGLSGVATLRRVVLPQALRSVVPAVVGQFISLLKDTSLVLIVGLTELFGVARSVSNQPAFLGHFAEALLFTAVIYFVLCSGLSTVSRSFEARQGERA